MYCIHLILLLFMLSSFIFPQYNVGDTINEEHLSMTFDTCFGDISEVTFGDYQNSSVIWLNFGATW